MSSVTVYVYYGFPGSIFKMLAMENDKKPKFRLSIIQLLFVTNLQYLPLNVCLLRYQKPKFVAIMGINCSHKNCSCHIVNNFERINNVIKRTKLTVIHSWPGLDDK